MEMPGAGGGHRAKHGSKIKRLNPQIGLDSATELVIKLPDAGVLRVVSRSLFLTLALLALPSIRLIIYSGGLHPRQLPHSPSALPGSSLGSVFRDVADRGLLKKGHTALVVVAAAASSSIDNGSIEIDEAFVRCQSSNGIAVRVVKDSDLEEGVRGAIPDQSFDFAFVSGSLPYFVDRVVKNGGVLVARMSNKSFDAFQMLPNYKIVYLRRFESTVIGLRKMSEWEEPATSLPARWQICRASPEAKRRALEALEGALLEPPRRVAWDSDQHLGRTKYLPDLLGHDLEGYPRRVFINVDSLAGNRGGMQWFQENYPTGGRDFDVYNLKTVTEEATGMAAPPPRWISDWLRESVREDEFVVMKAEAEVVEEMMRWKAICLVDELFLECENQWQSSGDGKGQKKRARSSRAYWECLALFGRLREEGVAVHQWWG